MNQKNSMNGIGFIIMEFVIFLREPHGFAATTTCQAIQGMEVLKLYFPIVGECPTKN